MTSSSLHNFLALVIVVSTTCGVDACEPSRDREFRAIVEFADGNVFGIWTIPKSEAHLAWKLNAGGAPGAYVKGVGFYLEGPHKLLRVSVRKLHRTHQQLLSADFAFSDIADADLAEISKCKRLRKLVLDNTSISDAGLRDLREMQHLQTLSIAETTVTDEGVASLKRALPMLKINRESKPFKESSAREKALSEQKAEDVRREFEQQMRRRIDEQAKRRRVEEED